jgi:hypothetical protein
MIIIWRYNKIGSVSIRIYIIYQTPNPAYSIIAIILIPHSNDFALMNT